MEGSLGALYRKISKIEDPKAMPSIFPVLDKWILDGRVVDRSSLLGFIKEFRRIRRYNHALQISMWMTDKRYYRLSCGDVAIRLDLISKVHGIEQVENYFKNIPKQLKFLEVYSALLNCYVRSEQVEKAEALMQQMKDIGLPSCILVYNVLLNLYYKTGSYGKMDNLLHEIEEKGIVKNKFTYTIQISAYAVKSDVEGIHKILTEMKTDPKVLDWSAYSTAASGCIKAGLVD
nr:pentatricopeptide repeat-containing protein At2g20710, mitochondrial-like [Ziziphus jujuba var. spinosa]